MSVNSKKKLPFDFTPQIYRYIEELIDIAEKTLADGTGDEVIIDNYQNNEPKSPEIELNNSSFWEYLESIGAVKLITEKIEVGAQVEGDIIEKAGVRTFYFSKRRLSILNIRKIRKVLEDRESKAVIKPQALELIAKKMAENSTAPKLIKLLKDSGLSSKMIIYPETKWRMLLKAFRVLSTSPNPKASRILYKIIEASVHPLFFDGDDNKASEVAEKYNKWLKYDRITISDGKLYLGPTDEEYELGIDEWYTADGEYIEPKGYPITPKDIAELWVLWNQVILVVGIYQDNSAIDKNELEKLYLDLIDKTEKLVIYGSVGMHKEKYKRPFTSLSTANIESRAQGAETPLDLVGLFLLQIAGSKPDPTEVTKQMEKHSELIKKVALITKAIGGDKINVKKLSYDQALFILKMYMSSVSDILEAVGTGFIGLSDTTLNTKYILSMDTLNEILDREDFATLKKLKPEYLPEHLFQGVDELETWWEGGGQSSIINFIGDIETAWIRNGQQVFPISIALNRHFYETDETVKNYKKYKNDRWEQVKKNLDENLKGTAFDKNNLSSDKNLNQTIKHEHTHRFENSIQEKEIGLNIKNIEDHVVVKNNKKRTTLPRFPRTEWSKVSITFIGERNILLSNGKDTKPSSFEGLACSDGRTGKPDDSWDFLLKLAIGNGQTSPISKKEREKQKKQKQKITDTLRKIFDNDSEPFETQAGGVYKAKFNIKYNVDSNEKKPTNDKYADLDEVLSEMTEPVQESTGNDFSQ